MEYLAKISLSENFNTNTENFNMSRLSQKKHKLKNHSRKQNRLSMNTACSVYVDSKLSLGITFFNKVTK